MIRDVLIAGAGPAGAALARMLAERGHSILLLDSATFPREKLCGEFVGPGCRDILDELGALEDVENAALPVRGMRVTALSGSTLSAHYPGDRAGFALRRSVFDHLLLKNALRRDIEFLEGCRVENLIVEDGAVRGVTGRLRGDTTARAFRARLIVGADGRNSVVGRRLGFFHPHRTHRRTALCTHYEGVERLRDCAEVFLGPDCYGILNPLNDATANLILVVESEQAWKTLQAEAGQAVSPARPGGAGPAQVEARAGFRHFLGRLPRLEERLGAARPTEVVRVLGPLACHATRFSWHGAVLVGDAAGFYDPFTGEGVYMALRGAQLAAGVIHEALTSGDVSARFLARYDAARRELAARYRLEALVQQLILRPRLAEIALSRLAGSPRAAGLLMGVLGGLLPPRQLYTARFAAGFLSRDRAA